MMSLAPDLHASTTNTTSHRFTSTQSFIVIDLFNLNVLDFTITSTQQDVFELVRTRTFTLKIKTLLSHPVSHRIIQQPNPVYNITVVDGHP